MPKLEKREYLVMLATMLRGTDHLNVDRFKDETNSYFDFGDSEIKKQQVL